MQRLWLEGKGDGEARKARAWGPKSQNGGWNSWEGQPAHSPPARGLRSAISSHSGVRCWFWCGLKPQNCLVSSFASHHRGFRSPPLPLPWIRHCRLHPSAQRAAIDDYYVHEQRVTTDDRAYPLTCHTSAFTAVKGDNLTSNQVQNVLHCNPRRTEPWPRATCAKISRNLDVLFETHKRTDKKINKQTATQTRRLQYFTHLPSAN